VGGEGPKKKREGRREKGDGRKNKRHHYSLDEDPS
jgi:hypothetical protein